MGANMNAFGAVREAEEAVGRCARLECEYHKKPSRENLMRCKGCGVYYCSRDCQIKCVLLRFDGTSVYLKIALPLTGIGREDTKSYAGV